MRVVATVVEWSKILQVIWASLAAVVGFTIAFSITVAGATRFAEARRDSHPGQAGAWAVVAFAGLAVCGGAIALGIVVMTTKS